MGLFSPDILQQQKAATAGVQAYPKLSAAIPDATIADLFDRETLTPTGAYTLYTVASNDSNGTAAINNATELLLTTDSSAIGDDVDVRVSGVSMIRTPDLAIPFDSEKSRAVLDIRIKLNQTADTEAFIGIVNQASALTALPTTASHVGIQFDKSGDDNWTFTSANGAQVTTDSTVAATTTAFKIRITWTGNNAATVQIFDTDFVTVLATETVTSISSQVQHLHFFLQTEATAAKEMDIQSWSAEFS